MLRCGFPKPGTLVGTAGVHLALATGLRDSPRRRHPTVAWEVCAKWMARSADACSAVEVPGACLGEECRSSREPQSPCFAAATAVSWRSMSVPHRLKCAETWASNRGASSLVDLPGLRVWVHSTPFGAGDAGGDVHYISVCPSCLVSRVALADVSGHGQAVASLSVKLRELMQKYLTSLEQASLMRDLNEAVMVELDGVHYATMVAVGFHERRGLLVMTNAGHPPAFWYRANRHEWAWFEPRGDENLGGVKGAPLGLLPNVSYDRMIVRPEPGDLIVLYSDGVSEATNPAGTELGRDDLLTLARAIDPSSADAFGMQLVQAVSEFRAGRVPEDDVTVIVLQRLSAQPS